MGGGLFLIAKSPHEIHQKLEGEEGGSSARVVPTFTSVIIQILLLIGVTLIVEGFDGNIPRGYIYFAMAFSMSVKLLNMRVRSLRKAPPVKLHQP